MRQTPVLVESHALATVAPGGWIHVHCQEDSLMHRSFQFACKDSTTWYYSSAARSTVG